ncbi:DUF4179 domain-containing protein [Ornithinibacillus massiliensis]|uniref:DUF4179 domain-containing protein n=1 Tax=Ornithinibacillus massiliensis TaxID=1944633 RepID=A0ABS5MHC4_9BACI|nr:DUF4179 domain-containing protein [Ornithinibacillus massiliensis]MBS3681705.1 DUF4179 domain-containing protein [Ornithinibacillus massiliensis]
MEKLRGEISRMVDGTPIPEQKLQETVQDALIKARNKEKKPFYFPKQRVIATIASIFVLAFGLLLLSNDLELASGENPNTTSIMYQQSDDGLKRMVTEGRSQRIDQEVVDQGIKVRLEEGYMDNHQLAISYEVHPEKENEILFNEWFIDFELLVDGKSHPSLFQISQRDVLDTGGVIHFNQVKDIEPNAEISLHINKVNDVEGDWFFQFHLDKEMEFLVSSDFEAKQDALGNSMMIGNVELSPSTLKLIAYTKLKVEEPESGYTDFNYRVIGMGKEGHMYLLDNYSSGGNTPKVGKVNRFNDVLEIPRGVNVYSYQIIPYITTFQGEEFIHEHYISFKRNEHHVPFAEGEIVGSHSEFKVESIKHKEDATIITYTTDQTIPVFPYIVNKEKDEYINAVSFQYDGDNKVIVTYPKVDIDKDTHFMLDDATYQVFPELETRIDLK